MLLEKIREVNAMNNTLITSLISLAGTLIGTFSGIIVSSRLLTYRVEQLEKKVDKHNNVIERVYSLEEKDAVQDEQLRVVNHRIKDLEHKAEVS